MSYRSKHKFLALRFHEVGVMHFSAKEVLTLGGAHYSSRSSGYGLNTLPPDDILTNIIPALRALEEARVKIGNPVGINSTYRSPAYNQAIGGAARSKHLTFTAIDCYTFNPEYLDNLYRLLKSSRDKGEWSGGLGGYKTFVHIDCGSTNNRTWGLNL